ncbi:PhzF family phenazine biosynthesis protein [Nocardioides campestrisoli]|uniref:PhzF family phenazine biosynthesis protein n=1 Tax=Nocardioides campestrisoli TaxID=2736757 RepID=UPI00163D73F5|nr:PhzF family phenazine biosynthesis protein [Nocardioides campestrisoli]
MHRFSQVDVFSDEPHRGNPVAVVHAADDLDEGQMSSFARWTNLSETTFLLPPTQPGADYRVRIFTPTVELPFAGHPTLGSAHAWLEAGGEPRAADELVQECAAGLVRVRRGERLELAAPPLVRSGPVGKAEVTRIAAALRLEPGQLVDAAWVDNGPGWLGLLLDSAQTVLALDPDWGALAGRDVGVLGPYPDREQGRVGAQVEVRAFCAGKGMSEDPVTGSLNAGLAQWLTADGRLPARYVAAQGTVLGRAGRVHVRREEDQVWVGGATRTVVRGEVDLSR